MSIMHCIGLRQTKATSLLVPQGSCGGEQPRELPEGKPQLGTFSLKIWYLWSAHQPPNSVHYLGIPRVPHLLAILQLGSITPAAYCPRTTALGMPMLTGRRHTIRRKCKRGSPYYMRQCVAASCATQLPSPSPIPHARPCSACGLSFLRPGDTCSKSSCCRHLDAVRASN